MTRISLAGVYRGGLAFVFIYVILAASHLLMVVINAADALVSAERYRSQGMMARWRGDVPLTDALLALGEQQRASGNLSSDLAGQIADRLASGALPMLPVSPFLVMVAVGLSLAGLGLLILSRRVSGDAHQTVLGVFAGLLIWTGGVEYGLMAASRLLGVAKVVGLHEGRIVGRFGEYVLLKHTWGLLFAVMGYLLFQESVRCGFFVWLRRRFGLMRGPVATGRVDNYAPRTAFEFITIVWTFYVLLLWAYDDTVFGVRGVFIHAIFFGSLAVSGVLFLRLCRQPALGPAIRYAIGVAVIAWNPVEIAAKWGVFHEPWLILNPLTACAFFGGAGLGTWLILREIARPAAPSAGRISRLAPGKA